MMSDSAERPKVSGSAPVEDATKLIDMGRQCSAGQELAAALDSFTRAVACGYPANQIREELVEAAEATQKDGSILIPIAEGDFIMGSATADAIAEQDEKPVHRHHVEGYRLALHPVTNAQYKRFVDKTGYPPPKAEHGDPIWQRNDFPSDKANHPVVWVAWGDAQAYCEWARLRLPTEAEWEKAARGVDGRTYPWGDHWDQSRCACYENPRVGGTCSVWQCPEGASPYGLHHMGGNVWEWCADWYDPEAYQTYVLGNFASPPSGAVRVLRGGYWGDTEPSVRAAARGRYRPGGTNGLHGFRCASSID